MKREKNRGRGKSSCTYHKSRQLEVMQIKMHCRYNKAFLMVKIVCAFFKKIINHAHTNNFLEMSSHNMPFHEKM